MSEELNELVASLNRWPDRPTNAPLVVAVECKFCGHEFPVAAQTVRSIRTAQKKHKEVGPVCSKAECRTKLHREQKERHYKRKEHK